MTDITERRKALKAKGWIISSSTFIDDNEESESYASATLPNESFVHIWNDNEQTALLAAIAAAEIIETETNT